MFDHVREEQQPAHHLTSKRVEIQRAFLIRKVVTVVTIWTLRASPASTLAR